jgi:hypothetical protein
MLPRNEKLHMAVIERSRFMPNTVQAASEVLLYEHFRQNTVSTICGADVLSDRVFSPHILKLMMQDILAMTPSGVFDNETEQTWYAMARRLCELDGFIPPNNGQLLYAIPILWIAYCTEYKNYGRTWTLSSDIRGLLKNESVAQSVICSEYLNTMFAPPSGKIGMLYDYFRKRFGIYARQKRNVTDLGEVELDALLYLLDATGFRYCGADKTVMLIADEKIRGEWLEEARQKLSF